MSETGHNLGATNSYGIGGMKPPGLDTQQAGKIQPVGPSWFRRVFESFQGLANSVTPKNLGILKGEVGGGIIKKKIQSLFQSKSPSP